MNPSPMSSGCNTEGPCWHHKCFCPVRPCLVAPAAPLTLPPLCRAEATDVANLVLDSVDGVMLGAETLRGKYPVLTVKTVLNICRQAELVYNHDAHFDWLMADSMAVSQASSSLVVQWPEFGW